MSKQAFYNGILYQIEYQPELSNNDYTQHIVYHIKTEDENYPHARKAIAYIKVFGNLIAITPSEVARFEKKMTIIWK